MYLKNLEFVSFRNLENTEYTPCENINVVYGDNAQGKTNLLEAVWMFCGAKSFRGTRDKGLVNFNAEFSRLDARFFSAGREQNARIKIDFRRTAVLNGVELPSVYDLNNSFCAVVFAPDHLNLIKGEPKLRRSFLDTAISSLRPNYQKNLSIYIKALKQRNAVLYETLRRPSKSTDSSELLEIFENVLAEAGAYIIRQRYKYIESLNDSARKIYMNLCDGKEDFVLTYSSTFGAEITGAELKEELQISRSRDIQAGITGIGPHRDDVDFFINYKPVRIFGSQGQQRSAVLSLKLGEAEILKKHCGEQPVAILDDVMSELDPRRQDYILNHIKDWQVFISCCDPDIAAKLKSGKSVKIENGKLIGN